jgi:hypothetical protein
MHGWWVFPNNPDFHLFHQHRLNMGNITKRLGLLMKARANITASAVSTYQIPVITGLKMPADKLKEFTANYFDLKGAFGIDKSLFSKSDQLMEWSEWTYLDGDFTHDRKIGFKDDGGLIITAGGVCVDSKLPAVESKQSVPATSSVKSKPSVPVASSVKSKLSRHLPSYSSLVITTLSCLGSLLG